MPHLVVLGQTLRVRTYVSDPPEKWAPRVPTFKVTQGHWNRHRSFGYL